MQDIHLKLLEDLVALSRSNNLYQAAELRNVTHPAFGRRIRSLEAWAGVPLLDRGHQTSQLNAAGRLLLSSAQEVLGILEHTRETLQGPARARAARITIAAGRTLAHSVLPPLLERLRRAFPSVLWNVSTTSLGYGLEMLERGEADMLLCHVPIPAKAPLTEATLVGCRVGSDELIAVSAPLVPGHPRWRVPRAASDSEAPFLAYAPSMSLGRILKDRLPALCATQRLRTVYEADLADAILAMVREGTGLAWLPGTLIRQELAQGTLVRADTASNDIPMEIHLYRRGDHAKPLGRQIWQQIERLLKTD
ncbi:LysR family transcriptional regulator [Variovorax sp. LT1R16]|uniref:LysR family transcriptional regulator n=1 Tax=Variovorax sp. LT1R16 TaxID=3443728 RepID=UPI003F458C31